MLFGSLRLFLLHVLLVLPLHMLLGLYLRGMLLLDALRLLLLSLPLLLYSALLLGALSLFLLGLLLLLDLRALLGLLLDGSLLLGLLHARFGLERGGGLRRARALRASGRRRQVFGVDVAAARVGLAGLGGRHRRMAHLGALSLRHGGRAVRGYRGQSLHLLGRGQRRYRVARDIGRHGGAGDGHRRARGDLRAHRGGKVRLVRHLRLERPSARRGAGRRFHCHVGDVAHVGDRVVGHAVVVDRVARIDCHVAGDAHANRHHRRRADHHRRRRADRRRDDQARA